jgi:hypothetical protein
LDGCISTPCYWLKVPIPLEQLPLPGTTGPCSSEGGSLSPGEQRKWVLVAQRTWEGLGTNLGAPFIRHVRTWVQIQTCLKRQKGVWSILRRYLSNALFWSTTGSFRFREHGRNTVLCKSVWKCKPKT